MSGPRTRTFDDREAWTGSLYYVTWRYRTHYTGLDGACYDIEGNREGANPFYAYKRNVRRALLNGTLYGSQGQVTRRFTNYPLGYSVNMPTDPRTYYPAPDLATCNQKAWEILAGTNPSSPHMNLLSFTAELKDIPSLVKDWGRGLLRKVAKGHLSWRWCLKPMIGDIFKMIQFVETANKRFAELRRLRDGKTIRKRVGLGTDHSATIPYRVLLNSDGAAVYGWRQDRYTRKMWGSAEWKIQPDSYIINMEDRKLMKFTRRMLKGLTTQGALEAAWELVPWSWFVDWFSNVGTLMSATNNSVGCTWGRLCLMITTTTVTKIYITSLDKPTWVTVDGEDEWTFVRKDRFPVYPIVPFPLPYLPVLTARKLSILAALAALRR